MDDLISRSAMMRALSDPLLVAEVPDDDEDDGLIRVQDALMAVMRVPSVDAVPTKHAGWELVSIQVSSDDSHGKIRWRCTSCGAIQMQRVLPPETYCGCCGAIMDEPPQTWMLMDVDSCRIRIPGDDKEDYKDD